MTHQLLDSGARQWSLLVLVPQDGPMPWATYLPWWRPWTHRRHLAAATRTRIWTMTPMDGLKFEIPWGNPSSNSSDFILQYGIVSKACVEVRWARVEGWLKRSQMSQMECSARQVLEALDKLYWLRPSLRNLWDIVGLFPCRRQSIWLLQEV